MSYAATAGRLTTFVPSFVTSSAFGTARRRDVPVALLRLLGSTRPSSSPAVVLKVYEGIPQGGAVERIVHFLPRQNQVVAATPLSTVDMARGLKDAGLPVSAIAEIVGVERKSVYAWIDGKEARAGNLSRLEQLHSLFRNEPEGSLKWFHRYWERPLDETTLRELLTALELDEGRIRAAIAVLRPAVTRALENERKREPEAGPPGLMNLHLSAGA